MKKLRKGMMKIFVALSVSLLPINSQAQSLIIDNLKDVKADWTPFSDQVMGGISKVNFYELQEEDFSFYRLEGNVSTENNGGFIQFRSDVNFKKTDFSGIRIKARGNNEEYFLHIRTAATVLPWDYYGASFKVTADWQWIEIPFSNFKKTSFFLPGKVKSSKIKTIGVVAYGKDFFAEVDIAGVELY